jgi:hypothetical protein
LSAQELNMYKGISEQFGQPNIKSPTSTGNIGTG